MSSKKANHIIGRISSCLQQIGAVVEQPAGNPASSLRKSGPVLAAILAVIMILAILPAVAAANPHSQPFHVTFDGDFQFPPGPGNSSALFVVTETGAGVAEGFGSFTFSSTLKQNSAVVPKDCVTGIGNSAVDGTAVLSFADGDMKLLRSRGSACVVEINFPNLAIELEEEWMIVAGGTGRYRNATGKLNRTTTGTRNLLSPGPHPAETTFSGLIQFGGDGSG